jgi:endonuclease/exonuclease/phosphatase (EEP) superfamily protein YafD
VFLARFWFVAEWLNCLRLQWVIALSILSVCWWCSRRPLIAIGLIAVSLVVAAPLLAPFSLRLGTKPATEASFTVLSYNIQGLNEDKEPTIRFFTNSIPDILAVLEYEAPWVEPLAVLDDSYAYSIKEPRTHGFAIALYSRFPLRNAQVHQLTKEITDNPFITAEVTVRGRRFIIAAGHFLSPLLTPTKTAIRNQQIREAAEILSRIHEEAKLPIVFVGDLNTVPWSPFLADFKRKCSLVDSRMGFGYQGTWPTDNPFLLIPIDQAFVSEGIVVHDRQVLSLRNSDHYPVFLTLSVGTPNDE